jgi:hypothetical protein
LKIVTVIVFLLALAFAAFAVLNWSAIAAPTALSIGFTTVHAPLGLILLTGSGVITAAFVSFVVYQQVSALLEARRFARDLHAERALADKAEASRFTDLRTYLEGELRALNERAAAARAETDARMGQLEVRLADRLTEVANGLSAHVSEVEDKIDRALRSSAS